MPRGFQSTLLILLPKKDSRATWEDFRPISLCNVNNKVLTMLLVSPATIRSSFSYYISILEWLCFGSCVT